MRATRHGLPAEAEVRAILAETVHTPQDLRIGTEIHRIGQEVQDMDDLEIPRSRSENG